MKIINKAPVKTSINNTHYPHSRYLISVAKGTSRTVFPKVQEVHQFINARNGGSDYSPHACVYTNQLDQAIPCSRGLYDFAMELKKHMPDVDFLLPQTDVVARRSGLVVSLVVYRPGDIFAMGEIGQYDPAPLKESWNSRGGGILQDSHDWQNDTPYLVGSPYIDNARYREDSRGSAFKIAVKMDVAIRNAKKYLRTYSPMDTGVVMGGGYARVFKDAANEFTRQVATFRREILYGDKLDKLTHALNAIQIGQTDKIMDSDLAEFVVKFEEAKRNGKEASTRPVNTTFVMVSRSGAIVSIPFASSCIDDKPLTAVSDPVVYETIESVPEDLMGATAVLDMVKCGEYIDGVGMRADERAYWVGA